MRSEQFDCVTGDEFTRVAVGGRFLWCGGPVEDGARCGSGGRWNEGLAFAPRITLLGPAPSANKERRIRGLRTEKAKRIVTRSGSEWRTYEKSSAPAGPAAFLQSAKGYALTPSAPGPQEEERGGGNLGLVRLWPVVLSGSPPRRVRMASRHH